MTTEQKPPTATEALQGLLDTLNQVKTDVAKVAGPTMAAGIIAMLQPRVTELTGAIAALEAAKPESTEDSPPLDIPDHA